MEARIEQWGNSLALRIPPSEAQQMALAADAAVSLEIRDGKLSVWPAEQPPLPWISCWRVSLRTTCTRKWIPARR